MARTQPPETPSRLSRLTRQDMESILEVTRHLASPFDLQTLLAEVTAAASRVLRAERASIWLHDPAREELVLKVSRDISDVRVPVGQGLVGACAREGRLVNTPDCYADERFNRSVDLQSGFRTRCSLALPLIDHQGTLVGVMQLLNKRGGVFDSADEALAEALAAQCAMALQRARMTATLIEGERLRQELALAQLLQQSTLPQSLPELPEYEMHGQFMPAAQTGGDTYDLAQIPQGLLVVLADATGHGIAPALSVLQMHAMLRMALSLGVDLDTAFRQVNDQLAQVLPDGHFVTAFIGLLDAAAHRVRFFSGGQAPILHFVAAQDRCVSHGPTSFPMGAMPIQRLRPAVELVLAPGDFLVLLSDGIYEYENPDGALLGAAPVEQLLREAKDESPAQVTSRLLDLVKQFARGSPQHDDITMVVLKRRTDGHNPVASRS